MLANPGLYVHIPWCVKKCPYCDFNSHPVKGVPVDYQHYGEALLTDWHSQQPFWPQASFASVFIGGGTPSLCPPSVFADLLSQLPLDPNCEVTMEANPGTAEYHQMSDYRDAGINRLSLGAQSFDDQQLRQLGRIHAAAETRSAFAKARAAGFNNINIDIMWGLPGQTVAGALADLAAAIALAPEHISWYQLTIEAKTEFARRTPILPVEDRLAEMEQQGLAILAEAGYVRYEVSAYARASAQCQHNLNYWRFGDYLGIGAGAHGKVTQRQAATCQVQRTAKASQPRLYQAEPRKTRTTPVTSSELPAEFMLNVLRLVDGVSKDTFAAHTGLSWDLISPRYLPLVDAGLLRSDVCATTAQGLRYLDSVVGEFL
ncbi:MAG: radical SAM family heme chaperone HemW [Pseudomonadota bacterium]